MKLLAERWTGRLRFSTALLGVWSIGVLILLMKLGGECPVAGDALSAAEARGWTLHYVVEQDRAGEELVRHLTVRGRLPLATAEISLSRDGPTRWSEQLVRAGWTMAQTINSGLSPAPSRLEILDQQRVVVWSGLLPANELSIPGAQLLDVQLLARVIRGQSVPRLVPVGCASSG